MDTSIPENCLDKILFFCLKYCLRENEVFLMKNMNF